MEMILCATVLTVLLFLFVFTVFCIMMGVVSILKLILLFCKSKPENKGVNGVVEGYKKKGGTNPPATTKRPPPPRPHGPSIVTRRHESRRR